MTDPVIVADGHSYERASIQGWFDRGKNTSPLTNVGLKHLNLTPNINLRKLIQDYWQSQQQSKGAAQYTPTQGNAIPKSLMCLSQHFHGLDLIRAPLERALGGWKPPVVVVFGQESCGKSTLLERIAMVPLFPKGADLCTRLPILVELRNGPHRNPILCTMERRAHQADAETVVPCDFSTAEDHAVGIQNIMLAAIAREHQKIAGISSTTYLKLSLTGPHLPNLDLMDLPGLVVNPSNGEPESMHDDTHTLVDAIIEETTGRAVFLAMREIGEKAKTSQAIKVLKRHPEILSKTLGVFTKCDDANAKKIRKMLKEQTGVHLPLGNVITMNAPPEDDEDPSLDAQARREIVFFEEEGFGELIHTGRATCNSVVQSISHVYLEFLYSEWLPHTRTLLSNKKLELVQQNRDLGLPEAHDGATRVTLEQGVQRFLPEIIARAALDVRIRSQQEDTKRLSTDVLDPLKSTLVSCFQKIQSNLRCTNCLNDLPSDDTHKTTFVNKCSDLLTRAVRKFVMHAPNRMREALLNDVGSDDGGGVLSAARVGRFPVFIEALVAKEKTQLEANVAPLQDIVLRKLCSLSDIHFSVGSGSDFAIDVLSPHVMADRLIFALRRGTPRVPLLKLNEVVKIAEGMGEWRESYAERRVQVLGDYDRLETLEKKLAEVFEELEDKEKREAVAVAAAASVAAEI